MRLSLIPSVVCLIRLTTGVRMEDENAVRDQAAPAFSFLETPSSEITWNPNDLQRRIVQEKEAKAATKQLIDKISTQSLALKSEIDDHILSMQREKRKIDDSLAKQGVKSNGFASSFAQTANNGVESFIRRERDRLSELSRKWKTDAQTLASRFNLESEDSVLNTPELASLHDKVTNDDKRLKRLEKAMDEDLRKVRNDVALSRRFAEARKHAQFD